MASRSYGLDTFWLCVHCDLGHEDMTLGRGQVKVMVQSWGMDDNNVKILFRSNMAVRSYGPDTDFGYSCTMTLSFEI